MDKKNIQNQSKKQNYCCFEEVSSIEWKAIDMTEEEVDIICRMHKLVGDRGSVEKYESRKERRRGELQVWVLIAGRLPGRKAEEIERFWLMRNSETFKRNGPKQKMIQI